MAGQPKTQELINEISDTLNPGTDKINDLAPVSTVQSLIEQQGTFVVKELVYAYAMWISPSFHLKVIRTFDAVMTGRKDDDPTKAAKFFKSIFSTGRLLGLGKETAMIKANHATLKMCGVDMLALLDLSPERQPVPTYLPSHHLYMSQELATRYKVPYVTINFILVQLGFITRGKSWYVPTPAGWAFGEFFSGSTRRFGWYESIFPLIEARLPRKAAHKLAA